jgi:hypothetical protein
MGTDGAFSPKGREQPVIRRTLVLLAALLILPVLAGPAAAATTDFNTFGAGTYNSPATAFITGKAICEGGTGTLSFANTPTRPTPVISGETMVVCDGLWHDYAATLTGGPFAPRQLLIFQGTLVAPSGTKNHPILKVVLR